MANRIKEKKTLKFVTYVKNRQINPTNICVHRCSFCDFSKSKGEKGAVTLTQDQILNRCGQDIKEIHMVGGCNPDVPFKFYLEAVREIRKKFPQIQIKAFTVVEIDFFAVRKMSLLTRFWNNYMRQGLTVCPAAEPKCFHPECAKSCALQK